MLAREPEEVQALLLQTAILTRLNGPLCDAVTGASGSQEMLERLERRNLVVVPLDDAIGAGIAIIISLLTCCKQASISRDLIRSRGYYRAPPSGARGVGQVAEAVGYALAPQDYRRAVGLIARYWHLEVNKSEFEKAIGAYAETIRLSRFWGSATGLGITIQLIGALRLLRRLRAADVVCHETLRYIQEQGMARLPAAGILHIAMTEVMVERNDLEAVESHLSQGIEMGKWSGRLDAVKNTTYALSRLGIARHDPNRALAVFQEVEAASDESRCNLIGTIEPERLEHHARQLALGQREEILKISPPPSAR